MSTETFVPESTAARSASAHRVLGYVAESLLRILRENRLPAEARVLATQALAEIAKHDVESGIANCPPMLRCYHDPICPRVCRVCRGSGADPMSDNMNWLPCGTCGGKGGAK